MKKAISALLFFMMIFTFSACTNSAPLAETTESSTEKEQTTPPIVTTVSTSESGDLMNETQTNKILIAYFSREGENYGVGTIEKGNTCIVAEMIAENNGGTLFEIERTTPYPASYDECTDEAKQEQHDNARPELTATVDDFEDYDIIFLGYPNWWGDMPMPVYTFLESYDFSEKTIIPFCTHAGSGLSSTVTSIQSECPDAAVTDGFSIEGKTAQKDRDTTSAAVEEWLAELNINE